MPTLRCLESFAFSDHKNGVERVVAAGTLVDSKDELVKGREHMFETVEANVARVSDRSVEQATAAPGEKRAARRPRSETVAAKTDDKPAAGDDKSA